MKNLAIFIVILAIRMVKSHPEVNPLSRLKHHKVQVKIDDDIKLFADPSMLNKSGSWVNVSWSGIIFPSSDDWIGVWVLPNTSASINARKRAPVKFQYCSVKKTHAFGYGEMSFYMVNMRGINRFALFKGGFDAPVMVAKSNFVSFQNPNEPLHGHLALTGDETEMLLMWDTRDANQPQVMWGTESGVYTHSKNATSSTYSAEDMCDAPATDYGWIDPGMIHRVVLDGLVPGTQYFYKFGDSYGYSDENTFMAAPVPGPSVTTRVLAIGDMGHGAYDDTRQVLKLEQPSVDTTRNLIKEMNMNHYDLLYHVGDLSYADGYEPIWDEYFDQVKPLLLRLPYMVNPGNHESDSKNSNAFYQGHDSGGECNVPYVNRFGMPRPGADQPWYGFDLGCIHFIMMSTEHDFRSTSDQYAFLDKHFQTINKTKTPWIIFGGHRPMYIDSCDETEPSGQIPVAKLLQANIEPLLQKYSVDLAFWGHHHTYQRMCPVIKGTCTKGATTHIVIGMAGRALLHDLRPDTPSFVAFKDEWHWGYTRFVANATTLVFEYIHNDDGQVHDSIVLTKDTD